MGVKFIGRAAFNAIYDAYADRVYRTALYYSENHHVAEEITQTVFMKLYMNIENINKNAVSVWLCTSAKHMAINYTNKRKREIPLSVLEEQGDECLLTECLEDELLTKLYHEELKGLGVNIFAELLRVNERLYDALTLTVILGKPEKEVAEIMGISYDNLRQLVSRAKKWVRKYYEEEYDHLNKA